MAFEGRRVLSGKNKKVCKGVGHTAAITLSRGESTKALGTCFIFLCIIGGTKVDVP